MLEMELLQSAHYELSPPVTGKSLLTAIDHLYKSLDLIGGASDRVSEGILDGLFTSSDLAQGWFEINSCRLYTESSLILEEYLQPAMGLINDAKSMIDSLVAWGLGLTPTSRLSILRCLGDAESAIRAVVEELENWMTTPRNDNECPMCRRKYIYGDKFCSSCGYKIDEPAAGH
jgi:hypothetical protein